jgi:N-acetylglutamate synthase-like GNAT family acetyltransferase
MPNRPFTFMAKPVIRDAARADSAALAALMGELGYPVKPEALWARIERMASPIQRTLLAEVDGRIAGFVGFSALPLYESDTPTCLIMTLSVGASFRRHGIGCALLAAVERWCAEAGIPDMRAHSGEARAEADSFYEACGFQRAGGRFKKAVEA